MAAPEQHQHLTDSEFALSAKNLRTRVTEVLGQERVESLSAMHTHQLEDITVVLDTQERGILNQTSTEIRQLQRRFDQGENVLTEVITIISRPLPTFPLLEKTWAVLFLADIFEKYKDQPQVQDQIIQEILRESLHHSRSNNFVLPLLIGLFAARWERFTHRKGIDSFILGLGLGQSELTPRAAEIILAIQNVSLFFRDSIAEPDLNMSFGTDFITESETLGKGETRKGEGYPDSHMRLAPYRLPSRKKMAEAILYGIPTERKTLLEKKLPTVGFGLETTHDVMLSETTRRGKNYTYLTLPSLALNPYRSQAEVSHEDFSAAKIDALLDSFKPDSLSLDSLSLYLAIRMQRHLEDGFNLIENENPKYPEEERQRKRIEKRKRSLIVRTWEKNIAMATTPLVERVVEWENNRVTIIYNWLKQAYETKFGLENLLNLEMQGNWAEVENQILHHLYEQAVGLTVEKYEFNYRHDRNGKPLSTPFSVDTLHVRPELNINKLFKKKVMAGLSFLERAELVILLLRELKSSGEWEKNATWINRKTNKLKPEDVELLTSLLNPQHLPEGHHLTDHVTESLVIALGQVALSEEALEYFTLRWETIRDKIEPGNIAEFVAPGVVEAPEASE